MGKKANKRKKQPNNQRGYATTNAVPSSNPKKTATSAKVNSTVAAANNTAVKSTSAVSSQDHQDLLHLLGALDDEDHSATSARGCAPPTTYISPDRFYKKVFNIHDTLDQLGFSFETIQKVVVALGYDITLETALDWLCLHLSTQDLPPLLTEGSVREQEQQSSVTGATPTTTSTSLEVLTPTRIILETDSDDIATREKDELPEPAVPVPPHLRERDREKKEPSPNRNENEQSSAKAWILQQYQFEEEEQHGEEEGVGDDGVMEEVVNDSTNGSASSSQALPAVAALAPAPIVDPNQKRLEEMEEQLRQREADLKDDASNYMRSKQEIKQMQNSTKKLRQQVQGLKKKMEKARAAAEREAAETVAVSHAAPDNGADMGGGFFGGESDNDDDDEEGFAASLFDQPIQSAVAKSNSDDKEEEEDLPPPSDPVVPKDSVPSGWTGKTPKEILEDWCKKEKLRKPQFFKLPSRNGARIRVDTKPNSMSMATDNFMGSYADAQQYLATKVLYQLNPDLPLYRLFPPYHRDLWRSWSESVQNKKEAVQKQESEAIAAKIQQLIDSVPRARQPVAPSQAKTTGKQTQAASESAQELSVRDCWDDDNGGENDNFDEIAVPTPKGEVLTNGSRAASTMKRSNEPTRAGAAIQQEFQKRQRTAAYQSMLEARSGLPMYSFREQILQTIKENPVTILCAEVSKF